MQATFSMQDDKIRIYPVAKLPQDEYERVKAAGFQWAPKQGCFYAVWSPGREDLAEELAGGIDDETTTAEERAEARAERFDGYGDKRQAEADRARKAVDAIADQIPFGQPILVGHHSQRRAERDAEKIKAGMSKAVKLWRTSQYWQQRASSVIAHAEYKELPAVRYRRIKKLESEKRKHERQQADAAKCLRFWSRDGITQEQAIAFTNIDDRYGLVLPDGSRDWSAWSALDRGTVTVEYVATIRRERMPDIIAHEQRWIDHLDNRIAYERAMLGEQGGTVADRKPAEKGGAVRVWCSPGFGGRGWSYVAKVNKVSVTVYDTHHEGEGAKRFTRTVPFDAIKGSMTAAEVHAAKDAGRLSEVPSGIGFYLTDELPAPRPQPKPAERKENPFEQMADSLRAGVQVVSAPNLFPTPEPVARRVVQLAEIEPGMTVLEPSAGTGAMIAGFRSIPTLGSLTMVEVNHKLASALAERFPNANVVSADFLETNANPTETATDLTLPGAPFDRVVMNPPFDSGTDIKHCLHAIRLTKPGGKVVAIVANGPRQQSELMPLADLWEELPPDTFAGTSVRSAIAVFTVD